MKNQQNLLIICAILILLLYLTATIAKQYSYVGRYKYTQISDFRRDQYLIDTVTGMVWLTIVATDIVGEPTVLRYIARIDNEKELIKWLGKQKFKEAEKKQ